MWGWGGGGGLCCGTADVFRVHGYRLSVSGPNYNMGCRVGGSVPIAYVLIIKITISSILFKFSHSM